VFARFYRGDIGIHGFMRLAAAILDGGLSLQYMALGGRYRN